MRPRYRNHGTGLHRYWYIRLIMLTLTIILPFAAFLIASLYYTHLMTEEVIAFSVFGWLIYTFVVIFICLKIESVLEKKQKNRNPQPQTEIRINGMQSLSDEEKRAVSTAFGQMNIVFSNANDDDDDDDDDDDEVAGVVCPKCQSRRVVKTDSGLCVCMKCAHRFDP